VLVGPGRHLDAGDGAEGARGLVAEDLRQPGEQPGHVVLAAAGAPHQLGPEDVEPSLEQPAQVGDVGLLGLHLLPAGPQLGQVELADVGREPRVEDPVDAALAAGNYLHTHPTPPGHAHVSAVIVGDQRSGRSTTVAGCPAASTCRPGSTTRRT
jgi:hypothetical protein